MAPPAGRVDGIASDDGDEPETIAVLHVDDNPRVSTMTADLLERESDAIVVETESGADHALDRLADGAFDCVVSDQEMPGTDGIEFLRVVRDEYGDLPFILFTGRGSEEVASEAISAGVTDYLQKEIGMEQYTVLANRIENAVERYRTRQALERERVRRSALFENTPDPIMATEVDGDSLVVTEVNPAFEDGFGLEAEEIVGRTVAETVVPDRSRAEYEAIRERVLAGEAVETEVERGTARGPREFLLRAIPIGTDDDPTGDYAWYTDVTERKERELALRELHDIATSITAHDTPEEVCRRTVEAAEVVLDFDRCAINLEADGELPITALSSGVPPDGATAMAMDEGLVGETFRTGESFLLDDVREHEGAKPQGQYRSALSIPIGDHGVFQAVTEEEGSFDEGHLELAELLVSHTAGALDRLERERTLEREQRRYQAVFDNPLSLIERLDLDGTVNDANRTAMDLVDCSIDDVVGEPFPETPWWSHSQELQEGLREWISRAAEGEYVRFEAQHPTATGDRIDVDGVLHPVTDEDGEPVEIVVAALDVTAAKDRQRALRRQNERLDEFVGVVSHDLRNPLSVLDSSLELASESGAPEDFDRCRRAVERMETLLDDLLTLAREGETVEAPEPLDLSSIVEACWRTVESGDASLRIETDAAVLASRSRLEQLLENLFRNAVEHGSTPSREDTVEHGGGGVAITVGDLANGFFVEDDGRGVPRDERERVFESGFSTAAHGTGFGLSIAAEIADAHGWEIRATESTDGGARFEITGVEFV